MPRRFAHKVDANQAEIVQTLRAVGLRCHDTSALPNFVDAVVSGYSLRHNADIAVLVEFKTERGKLTDSQKALRALYGADGPLIVARTANEVLRWFGRC